MIADNGTQLLFAHKQRTILINQFIALNTIYIHVNRYGFRIHAIYGRRLLLALNQSVTQ